MSENVVRYKSSGSMAQPCFIPYNLSAPPVRLLPEQQHGLNWRSCDSERRMFVYLLESAGCYYKIGIAENVQKRIKQLQTGNPNQITLRYACPTKDRNAALRLENLFHLVLQRFNTSGEWYKLDWCDAKTVKGAFYALSWNDAGCWIRIRRRFMKMVRDGQYYAKRKGLYYPIQIPPHNLIQTLPSGEESL